MVDESSERSNDVEIAQVIGEPSAIGEQGAPAKVKPYAGWAAKIKYDPDASVSGDTFRTPADEYVKRFGVREAFKSGDATVVPDFAGVLLQPVEESKRWKPVKIDSVGALKQFFESEPGKKKRLMEQFGDITFDEFTPSPGLSASRLIDTEFVPLLGGPFYKQLYIYDYLLMHSRAFEMVNHNALAAAAVKIMQRFSLGRGLSFHIKHPEARAVWDEFWERNNMRDKVRLIARDLSWQGEMLIRYYEPKPGYTTVRVLDASTCWEVVTDPEDVEQVYYYHFQWPTPYQIWVTGEIPVSKYIVQQVPPTNIQHMKINMSAQERRGRSDLLAAMAWFKRFNDFYNGATVKAMLEANLVWKVKVRGDQADIEALMNDPNLTELPPPGGVWLENDAVNLDVVSTVLTAGRGSSGIGAQLAAIIATSLNLPSEYFNIESGAAARATALVRTDPAVKAIEDRQQLLRELLEEMYLRITATALAAGRISKKAAREEPDIGQDQDGPEADEPEEERRDVVALR